MVGFLFGCHLLDAVVDVVKESVYVFSFKKSKQKHVIDFVLLLLDVTKFVFGCIVGIILSLPRVGESSFTG